MSAAQTSSALKMYPPAESSSKRWCRYLMRGCCGEIGFLSVTLRMGVQSQSKIDAVCVSESRETHFVEIFRVD